MPRTPLTEEQKVARAEKRQMTAALQAEEHERRREAKRLEWHDKAMYLTREQAAAGEPCRGCGLPVIDNLGSWSPLMKLTDEELKEYDAAQAQFKELHPDCHEATWSMEGSRTTHCFLCCPPVPISDAQREKLSRLLAGFGPRREEELDIWTRTLTCGHRVEQSMHHTNSGPSFATQWCAECGMRRGVVSSKRAVEAATRIAQAQQKKDAEVRRAQRNVAKAKSALAARERALAALKTER